MTKTKAAPRAPAKKPAAAKKATPAKPTAKKAPAEKKPRAGLVLAAVRRDLAVIAKVDKELANGTLAATAQALASEIDDPDNSPTSKATCARALADTLSQLRELAPKAKPMDGLDELADARATRRTRRAGA